MIGSQAWTLPLSGLVEISQSSESPCPACTFSANSGSRTTQLSHPNQSPIGAGPNAPRRPGRPSRANLRLGRSVGMGVGVPHQLLTVRSGATPDDLVRRRWKQPAIQLGRLCSDRLPAEVLDHALAA